MTPQQIRELGPEIEELALLIKDDFALCGSWLNKGEKETIVAQTIRACVVNAKDGGEYYSIKGEGLDAVYGGGLVDNRGSYRDLLFDQYLIEQQRGQKADGRPNVVIVPTRKLIDALKAHFAA